VLLYKARIGELTREVKARRAERQMALRRAAEALRTRLQERVAARAHPVRSLAPLPARAASYQFERDLERGRVKLDENKTDDPRASSSGGRSKPRAKKTISLSALRQRRPTSPTDDGTLTSDAGGVESRRAAPARHAPSGDERRRCEGTDAAADSREGGLASVL
jgi:hypothetical protein